MGVSVHVCESVCVCEFMYIFACINGNIRNLRKCINPSSPALTNVEDQKMVLSESPVDHSPEATQEGRRGC